MAFKVKDARRLQEEADRIQAILLSPHFRDRVWEEDEFIAHLEYLGLKYTTEELVAIRGELITRNVIELAT